MEPGQGATKSGSRTLALSAAEPSANAPDETSYRPCLPGDQERTAT